MQLKQITTIHGLLFSWYLWLVVMLTAVSTFTAATAEASFWGTTAAAAYGEDMLQMQQQSKFKELQWAESLQSSNSR